MTTATPAAGSAPATLPGLVAEAPPLTADERRAIVDQALVLLEQLYVHLPLKQAMHAVDPVQRLRLLRRRLEGMSERRFHDEMIETFIGVRDLHTNYVLPEPFQGTVAFLPFRMEEFFEGGTRRCLVTGVRPGLADPGFAPGVEVTHWNGVPVDLAVDRNGERNAGSNADARRARGLASMTQRPMALLAPPDEEWVDVAFRTPAGEARETRFAWEVFRPPPAPGEVDAADPGDPLARALGFDALTEAVRRAQKAVLAPEAIRLEERMAAGAAAEGEEPALAEVSTMPDVLEFRTVSTAHGDLGYLRIRTFMVRDVDEFIAEVVRILGLLPPRGLIVDVRGNGGGIIMAGERLLQLFTPRRIEPERLHFLNTPLTLLLTGIDGLREWQPSIAESVEIGTAFSDGFPVFEGHEEDCNSTGQRYGGPVVLVTDALCYSTTDIFAAGFQDHAIGPVLGTSGNTGAGGANVWTHDLLSQLLQGPGSPIRPLPRRASMRVAIRRTTRVGERSGDPLEDLGVVPAQVHRMTRRDLLERNPDLIEAAAALLAVRPAFGLAVAAAPDGAGGAGVTATTQGLDRIDVYVNGRPRASLDVGDGEHAVSVPAAAGALVEVRGFAGGVLAAARRATLGGG